MITFALFVVGLALAFRLGQMMSTDEARRTLDDAVAKYLEVTSLLEAERVRRDEIMAEVDGIKRLIEGMVK